MRTKPKQYFKYLICLGPKKNAEETGYVIGETAEPGRGLTRERKRDTFRGKTGGRSLTVGDGGEAWGGAGG